MAEHTGISWTDHTFNPWIGCTKISPACDDCYAEVMASRYGWAVWGAGEDRKRTAPSTWRQPITWNRRASAVGERRFVFCASLADVFDNEVDERWRRDLFALIEQTPNLVWLLLTKRIGNVLKMTDPVRGGWPLPANAALGATMANQEEYDRDRIKLWETAGELRPAFTFASLEPLLGPIVLDSFAPDWIIVGGESGRSPRPIEHEWVARLRDQSKLSLNRAFHFKQWGGRTPKANGKLLDGREWCERPVVAPFAPALPLERSA